MEALAVKYRPKKFDEVVSQKSIVKVLEKQLELGDYKNCYLFCGASGCGKAQPMWSKVLTPQGYVEMKDIKKGDVVFDGDGNITKVVDVFPQGEKHKIYKIMFDDGTHIEVADNHLNSIYYRDNNKKEYVDVVWSTNELIKELNKCKRENNYKLRVRTPIISFEEKAVPLDPYLLGILIGDGSLNDNSLGVSLNEDDVKEKVELKLNALGCTLSCRQAYDYRIVSKDSEKHTFIYNGKTYTKKGVVDKIFSDYGKNYSDIRTLYKIANGYPYYKKKYPNLHLQIFENENYNSSSYIKKVITGLGLNTLSVNKHIPREYLFNSKDVRLELLRGLMDSDGYVKEGYSFSTSSKQLSKDFEFLVRSLGCVDTVITKTPKLNGKTYTPSHNHYLRVPNNLVIVSSKKHLSRVHKRQLDYPKRKIIDIQYIGDYDCKCIYVESDCHTYITDNITVTHNTTLARIFANEINNWEGNPIEIDAASNNGVDNVRELVARANERALDCEYKVIIVDEAHILTTQAWTAFLKCLEEPPKYTIFMFCTTDPQKIPATIQNRLMRFNLTKIPTNQIKDRLKYICEQEHFTNYEEAIDYISKLANGGMRDAIALLDKASAYSTDLNIENVLTILGNFSYKMFFDITNAIIDKKDDIVISNIEQLFNQGNDLKLFIEQYLEFVLDLFKYSVFGNLDLIKIPPTFKNDIDYIVGDSSSKNYFSKFVDRVLEIKNTIRYDTNIKSTIEVMFIQMCRGV